MQSGSPKNWAMRETQGKSKCSIAGFWHSAPPLAPAPRNKKTESNTGYPIHPCGSLLVVGVVVVVVDVVGCSFIRCRSIVRELACETACLLHFPVPFVPFHSSDSPHESELLSEGRSLP